MKGIVYLRRGETGPLIAMEPRPYDAEAVLQHLLERDARLLAGAASGPAATRRWLLVRREQPVAGASGQGWAADHLFVDSDAFPTIVEVKRSSNTEIRRTIVGQLLDYMSNLARSTSVDRLRSDFEQRILTAQGDPETELRQSLVVDDSADEFWAAVGEHLARGQIRGYFVADEIPEELRRIVEYLNLQLGENRLFALEVARFVADDGTETLVPQLVAGSLQAPMASGSSGPPRASIHWDRQSVLAAIRDFAVPDAPERADASEALFAWAAERGHIVTFGRGSQWGSASIALDVPGRPPVVKLWVPGSLQVPLGSYAQPFATSEARQALFRRFTAVPGLSWGATARPDGHPGFVLGPFADPGRRAVLLALLDDIAGRITAAASAPLPTSVDMGA